MANQYHVVSCNSDVELSSFDSVENLLAGLKTLQAQELQLPTYRKYIIFDGERLYLTKGDLKQLVMPDGTKHILIPATTDELDPDGYLVDPKTIMSKVEPIPIEEALPEDEVSERISDDVIASEALDFIDEPNI